MNGQAVMVSAPSRRHVLEWMGGASSLALLSACSVSLPGSGSPPRIFVLTPKSTFDEDLPSVDWQLLVETPEAAAGIASSRIALRRSSIELQYFSRAAWTDSAPKMVQNLIIESFENSGKIISVGRQAIGLSADFIMKTDLREFQAEYVDEQGMPLPEGSAPNIRIRLNTKLVKMPDRRIVGSRTFEYFLPAPGPTMVEVVAGFDEVLGKILKRAVSWTLTEGDRIEREAAADNAS